MRYLFIISRQGVVIWWRKSEVGNIVDTSLNRNNLKERKIQGECSFCRLNSFILALLYHSDEPKKVLNIF